MKTIHGLLLFLSLSTACGNNSSDKRAAGTGGVSGGRTAATLGSGGLSGGGGSCPGGLACGGAGDDDAGLAAGGISGGGGVAGTTTVGQGGTGTAVVTGSGGRSATGGGTGKGGSAGRGPIGSDGGSAGRAVDGGSIAGAVGRDSGTEDAGRDLASLDTPKSDSLASGCVCSGGMTTWACYCQAYDCTKTIDAYAADGGLTYDVMVDWADCNFVEYANTATGVTSIFDRTTRRLVGELRYGTDPTHPNCPFPVMDTVTGVKAGTFPDWSCVASACVPTKPASEVCLSVPMAKKDAGRF